MGRRLIITLFPYSLFPIPYSLFPIPYSLFPYSPIPLFPYFPISLQPRTVAPNAYFRDDSHEGSGSGRRH